MRLDAGVTDDPAAFLAATQAHLAADPVRDHGDRHGDRADRERPVGRDGRAVPLVGDRPRRAGSVTGVAMRTAPFAPYPLYLLPMPDDAAVQLARALHERGEAVGGVNGALPAARVVRRRVRPADRGEAVVDEHLRLFELGELVVPPAPARPAAGGHPRRRGALPRVVPRVRGGGRRAGRPRGHARHRAESFTLEDITRGSTTASSGCGRTRPATPVHMTGANVPANGVTRIGPVYTPTEHRGRGYAGRAVAEVSREYLEQGVRCCLFTDQANPTSNRIYQALGYRPVVDMVNLVIR